MKSYEETVAALNEMIPEIHENAVQHGWWDEERTLPEIYSLIHSELSEALEEFRNDSSEVYCETHGSDCCYVCYGDTCEIEPEIDCLKCLALREESEMVPHKPEGAFVELADVVIRIMDYFGNAGMRLRVRDYEDIIDDDDYLAFPELIADAHAGISAAYAASKGNTDTDKWVKEVVNDLSAVVLIIWFYIHRSGFDLTEIVSVKHQYNKTRPYKHGGKRI